RIYADDWEQASHNGDLVHAVQAGVLSREDVAQLGDVLIGTAEGRTSDRDITIFDSTGLAIQDLAIALAATERADDLDVAKLYLSFRRISRRAAERCKCEEWVRRCPEPLSGRRPRHADATRLGRLSGHACLCPQTPGPSRQRGP